jgi:hypothetical protein
VIVGDLDEVADDDVDFNDVVLEKFPARLSEGPVGTIGHEHSLLREDMLSSGPRQSLAK